MNRIDRLTAILIQLQSKRVVKAQEIADRFGISLRTVYRDVRALEEAGIPLAGEAGVGYSLVEGYRLPPVMFTKEEAAALLFGAKLVDKMSDHSVKREFQSALFKIQSVLRLHEKDHLEILDAHVQVFQPQRTEAKFANNFLTDAQQAIVQRQVLWVEYFSNHQESFTQRELEPMGLLYYSQHWHLIAFCRLRQDYRDFRLDRIRQLQSLGKPFESRKEHSLQTYLERLVSTEKLVEAVIRFDKKVVRYIQEQKYLYGFVSEKDLGDTVEIRFLTNYLEALGRWLLMFGPTTAIVKPEELQLTVQKLAREVYQHYS
jgi:predicted DNA-binding transcriptional regulator YafY